MLRPFATALAVSALSLALAACDAAADDAEPTFGDPYTVIITAASPVVTGGRLAAGVEFSGGCKEHTFVLRSRVDGDAAEVWFVHDGRDDTCRETVTATVRETLPGTVVDAETVALLTPAGGRIDLAGR